MIAQSFAPFFINMLPLPLDFFFRLVLSLTTFSQCAAGMQVVLSRVHEHCWFICSYAD